MRDFQRSKVYKAERGAWECCDPEKLLSLEECQKLIKKAVRFMGRRCIPKVTDGRGRRRATFKFGALRGGPQIALPKWSRTRWVILHEYAHAVADDHHGPKFTRAYIKLVRRFIGKIEAEILKIAFKQYRVKTR